MTAPVTPRASRKTILSWALYDWANSAFATTVMAGFFPVFFTDYWSRGVEPTQTTLRLAFGVSIGSLVVATLAPFLGAMADQGGTKKRSLAFFTAVGVAATALLFFVGEGMWLPALLLYVLGITGFLSSLVFYDSLLVSISDERSIDGISARGFALGYLGGGLLFLLNVLAVQNPAVFGLSGIEEAVRYSFLSVAIWWAVFSIPLQFNVPEPAQHGRVTLREGIAKGFSQLRKTFLEIRSVRHVFLFLLAYWFYIDGVDTIITMAVNYGKTIGFGTGDVVTALLLVQFAGFPFALLMGWLGQRWGTKQTLLLCIAAYVLITFLGSSLDLEPMYVLGFEIKKFYALAFAVSIFQGGIQALSRSFYGRLIPQDKAAEFFGFYNMLGKFATIIGPVLMGTVGELTGNPRLGIQSIAVLFVAGAIMLWRVPERDAARQNV